ncbi:MAG: TetR/AcrR family transcriptional regulator [Clostridia bacterium]|nr:TetR/AcrR family transcriptional regulator [Clostridia bacterium]
MRTATYKIDRELILQRTFSFLVNNGLENVTIRELCKGTGLAQGTLYYWFGDKMNIICESAEYGFLNVADKIFEYVFNNMNDMRKFFSECLGEIIKYKKELRFIYQMAASPVYGERIRASGKDFNIVYNKYAEKLAEVLGCDEETLLPLVYMFISTVLDYVIWEGGKNSQIQLEYIYSLVSEKILKK